MNKGFTLIEIVIYIGLLSVLITGIFSSVISYIYTSQKTNFTHEDYELLIQNYHE